MTSAQYSADVGIRNIFPFSQGAPINEVDGELRTPLVLASARGAWEVVSLLLTMHASPFIKDKNGRNFLHLMAITGTSGYSATKSLGNP